MNLLAAVAIPPRLRGFESDAPALQAYDVALEGGRIARIAPVPGAPRGLLLSGLVDVHVHLDKNYTVDAVGAAEGDLFAAIARTAEHRRHWTVADLTARMGRALDDAWRCGTRALRTHLDWVEPAAPPALAAFTALRTAWQDRLALQFVSLTPLDLFEDAVAPGAGQAIAAQVAAAGGVLGAFVYRNPDLDEKVGAVFALARRHGLALDFHVDEGLDADAAGLAAIARATRVARAAGWTGRVTCGHACSLAVQPDGEALATLRACAEAGLHLVALPTTNLYLQGAWDRTPIERGLTRLKEAAAHGLRPAIATDNVADAFYPYGSYDLVETFGLGVQAAHLAPALDWLDAITVAPAEALGLPWDGRLREGAPADLVRLAARDGHELISPAGRHRTVIRGGTPLPATP